MSQHLKHIIIGTFGGLALLIFYFVFLTLANSFSHAISQLSQMKLIIEDIPPRIFEWDLK